MPAGRMVFEQGRGLESMGRERARRTGFKGPCDKGVQIFGSGSGEDLRKAIIQRQYKFRYFDAVVTTVVYLCAHHRVLHKEDLTKTLTLFCENFCVAWLARHQGLNRDAPWLKVLRVCKEQLTCHTRQHGMSWWLHRC